MTLSTAALGRPSQKTSLHWFFWEPVCTSSHWEAKKPQNLMPNNSGREPYSTEPDGVPKTKNKWVFQCFCLLVLIYRPHPAMLRGIIPGGAQVT